jgi:site-specific recombinase XerD
MLGSHKKKNASQSTMSSFRRDMTSFKKYKKGMHHIVQWLKLGHTRVVEIL